MSGEAEETTAARRGRPDRHSRGPPGSGDPYESTDTAELVRAALRTLPAQQRVVLVLRYWGGLSEREVADQLHCSVGTVKSRASRAIAALRQPGSPLAEALQTVEAA